MKIRLIKKGEKTNEKVYETKQSHNSNCALSSRCATCYDDAAAFRIRCIKEGSIRGDDVFNSWGGPSGMLYAFRPVVTLNSDVQLEADGTNTWKIK